MRIKNISQAHRLNVGSIIIDVTENPTYIKKVSDTTWRFPSGDQYETSELFPNNRTLTVGYSA